jgi:hypothetical protein
MLLLYSLHFVLVVLVPPSLPSAHNIYRYIGGHSDVVMGAVALNDEDIFRRLKFRMDLVLSPLHLTATWLYVD